MGIAQGAGCASERNASLCGTNNHCSLSEQNNCGVSRQAALVLLQDEYRDYCVNPIFAGATRRSCRRSGNVLGVDSSKHCTCSSSSSSVSSSSCGFGQSVCDSRNKHR